MATVKQKITESEIRRTFADPSIIDISLSRFYSMKLEENKKILDKVASKEGFTKTEKEEILNIIRFSARIQELEERIEYNKRSGEANAVEDTKRCEKMIDAYLKECDKYYQKNYHKYMKVEKEITKFRQNQSSQTKEQPKKKSTTRR